MDYIYKYACDFPPIEYIMSTIRKIDKELSDEAFNNKDALSKVVEIGYCTYAAPGDGGSASSLLNSLKCLDIREVDKCFKEFMDGMDEFFNELAEVKDDQIERKEKMAEMLEKAKNNAESFIISLFDGTIVKFDTMDTIIKKKESLDMRCVDNDIFADLTSDVEYIDAFSKRNIKDSTVLLTTMKKYLRSFSTKFTGLFDESCIEFMVATIVAYLEELKKYLIGKINAVSEVINKYENMPMNKPKIFE